MKVELDKKDIVALVVGGPGPYYDVYEHPLVKKSGRHIGGFYDRWDWDHSALNNMSVDELMELKEICENSWE